MVVMARQFEEFIVRKKMISKHGKKEEEDDGQRIDMIVYCIAYNGQLRTKKSVRPGAKVCSGTNCGNQRRR